MEYHESSSQMKLSQLHTFQATPHHKGAGLCWLRTAAASDSLRKPESPGLSKPKGTLWWNQKNAAKWWMWWMFIPHTIVRGYWSIAKCMHKSLLSGSHGLNTIWSCDYRPTIYTKDSACPSNLPLSNQNLGSNFSSGPPKTDIQHWGLPIVSARVDMWTVLWGTTRCTWLVTRTLNHEIQIQWQNWNLMSENWHLNSWQFSRGQWSETIKKLINFGASDFQTPNHFCRSIQWESNAGKIWCWALVTTPELGPRKCQDS